MKKEIVEEGGKTANDDKRTAEQEAESHELIAKELGLRRQLAKKRDANGANLNATQIKKLQEVFYKYTFESPLNFIMVKSDFKRFYESFSQARLSLLYSLELHKDSMFNVDW